jgi:hypothetical protein
MVVLALATRLAKRLSPSGFPRFETILVTQTPADDARDSLLPFCVIRQQGTSQLPRLIREADVVPVAGAAIAPILWSLSAKPAVVEHHGFQTICLTGQLFQEPQNVPCLGHFMAGNHGTCLRCCRATSSRLSCFRLWLFTFVRRLLCKLVSVNIVPTAWLANVLCLPRTETVPRVLPPAPPLVGIAGSQDVPSIAFVVRLVTTKGVRLLLEAAGILTERNRSLAMQIVGSGPERGSLQDSRHPRAFEALASTAHQRVIDVFTEEGMIDGHARIYEWLHPA